MPIQFICPNGHPLAAPRKQAGKPGRCPKCDVGYVTPLADEGTAASVENDEVSVNEVGEQQEQAEEIFQFLCPNGHKINAPARLAGEVGQCPRCGERFHIPESGAVVNADGQEGSGVVGAGGEKDHADSGEAVIPLGAPNAGWGVPVSALNGEQSMAEAVSWFWQEKGPGQQVELTLRDGSVLQPTAFAANVSSSEVGIFSEGRQGGGVTLRAIAWDAIAHVAVRNLVDEVDDLFRD